MHARLIPSRLASQRRSWPPAENSMESGYSQVLKTINSGRALSWCRQTKSQGSPNLYSCNHEVGPQSQITSGKGWYLPSHDGRIGLEASVMGGEREVLLRICRSLKVPQPRGPGASPSVSYLTLLDPCVLPHHAVDHRGPDICCGSCLDELPQ